MNIKFKKKNDAPQTLAAKGAHLDHALLLEAPSAVLAERLKGRLVHPASGAPQARCWCL